MPRTLLLLLIPHALSVLAFLAAMAYAWSISSNRSRLDLNLGICGYVCAGLGLVSTIAALVIFPYRTAGTGAWITLAGHAVGVAACVGLGLLWLALHIA